MGNEKPGLASRYQMVSIVQEPTQQIGMGTGQKGKELKVKVKNRQWKFQ